MSETGQKLLMPGTGTAAPVPPLLGLMIEGELPPDDDARSPRSHYAEMTWLASLGPTALWAARRIVYLARQERYLVETHQFSQAIGCAARPLCRALDRLVMFRVADWDFDRDPRAPVLTLQGTWPEAPGRGLAAAHAFHPEERNR